MSGASHLARGASGRKPHAARAFDQQLMLLADASSALLASPHTSDVLRTIIDLAQRFGAADGHAVWRSRPEGEVWTLVSSSGLSPEYVHTGIISAGGPAPLPKEPLVFEDVSKAPLLAARRDALKREGICSMLIVPLQVHGHPTGTVVFYWKTPHRFTESEVRIASALGNMAAAALGTAEIYERERALRDQAQLSEQRTAFLAEAGAVLSGSLDYEVTLRTVAKLAIPAFADWCAVDVSRNGALERVTLEHIDPAKIQLADVYREKYPPSEDDVTRVAFRTGEPVLIPHIPEELLIEHIPDPEQLQMVRSMGIESLIITPMVNRGRTLGLLTFVSSKPNRHYTAADLSLAQEIARRAAIALDNARLYAESQEAQNALRRSNEELRRVNEDLNHFAYSASHDLQEPLRMIATYTQLLQRRYKGRLDTQADEYISYAAQGAQRMEALVRDILTYTQVANIDEEKTRALDANLVLDKVLSNLHEAIEKSRASITAGQLPIVNIAEAHLVQLLQNLIGNAIKYSGDAPPRVEVQASRCDGACLFSVRDHGIGIDPKYSKLVFGLFKRLHTNAEYGGTGIGLAICQKIVKRYGGRIWVESARGQGATFYFTVPDRTPTEPRP